MFRHSLAFAVMLFGGSSALANNDSPVTYHVPGQTVIVHRTHNPIPLKDFPKMTWLHNEFTFQCVATTCLVTVMSLVQQSTGSQKLCAYLDGKKMQPGCQNSFYAEDSNLQSELVLQGTHKLHTGIVNGFESGGTVCPCEVNYYIYDTGN